MRTFQEEANAETLFTDHPINLLKTRGFEPVMPPESKAELTLFLEHLDRELVKETPDTIKGELETNLHDAEIDPVFIMNRYLMRIQLSDHQTAAKVQARRLYLYIFSSVPN